jgi:hypothetical protein
MALKRKKFQKGKVIQEMEEKPIESQNEKKEVSERESYLGDGRESNCVTK